MSKAIDLNRMKEEGSRVMNFNFNFKEVSIMKKLGLTLSIMVVGALAVSQTATAAVIEEVTLQGPNDSRNAVARIGFREDTNYDGSALRIATRLKRSGAWSLLDFDLDDYTGGEPVQNVEVEAYHYGSDDSDNYYHPMELRPLTKSWVSSEATAKHRLTDTEWDKGDSWNGSEAYITGKDGDGNWMNFTDEVLGESFAAGANHEDSTIDTWRTFSGEALDDYLNEVIDGTREHYGFLVYAPLGTWSDDGTAKFNGTSDETEVAPKMSFEVIPEPSTLVLLGLGGLLLMKRRRM